MHNAVSKSRNFVVKSYFASELVEVFRWPEYDK